MKQRLRNLIQAGRFILLMLQKKVTIGERKYSINGLCQNTLAIEAIRKNYEEWADKIFSTILDVREGVFIDVGANVGQTLVKLLKIDNNRQYIGFEPQVAGCFFIEQFIRDNKLDNHMILPIGLSDKSEVVKLGLREKNDVTASIIKEYRPENFYSYYQCISTIPGDDILVTFDLPSISVIKIDVEGGELNVIKGLEYTIEKYMPYIVFEVLPHYLFATKTELDDKTKDFRNKRYTEMDSVLRKHGYLIFQIRPDGELSMVNTIIAAKRELFNYVAVPQKEREHFAKSYESINGIMNSLKNGTQ